MAGTLSVLSPAPYSKCSATRTQPCSISVHGSCSLAAAVGGESPGPRSWEKMPAESLGLWTVPKATPPEPRLRRGACRSLALGPEPARSRPERPAPRAPRAPRTAGVSSPPPPRPAVMSQGPAPRGGVAQAPAPAASDRQGP